MLESPRGIRLIVAAALTLGIIAALGAGAAPTEPTGLKIAIFDPDKVSEGMDEAKKLTEEMRVKGIEFQTTLTTWKNNPLLTEAKQKRLAELSIKKADPAGLTPAEDSEMKQLVGESTQLANELQALQMKQTPADADKKRLTELTRIEADTETRLQTVSQTMQTQFQELQQNNRVLLVQHVRDGLAKVAKKEGMTVVFAFGLGSAWYGENDITENVTKQVNSDYANGAKNAGKGKEKK